ncbi:MFS transporter [Lactococcus insecticola]|uniref:MFS transporter n=1 Tax=Pseudolactococcus insecticola TaxID=2709158 RepID=A0A6A0B8I3_9LACT|nr:MFS transporter [Lactococcus insecticola]GFH40137.1 MFS transporter [Lactococcus insecticola]
MSKKTKITALVVLNFIIYISLGLPDSILGSAWPSMRTNYNMGAEQVSYLTTAMLLFSFLSSMAYSQIARKWQDAQIIFISMWLVIIGLALMIVTDNPYVLFLSTPFMGLGQGAIDVTVNHFAAKHLPSSLMSLLHGFYGVGVSLSAGILTVFLTIFASWRMAIGFIGMIELAILALIWFNRGHFSDDKTVPNTTSDEENQAEEKPSEPFYLRYLLIPTFYFFYAIEPVLGIFIASYYVEVFHVSDSLAALYTTLFWLGLTIGRFLTGALTRFFRDKALIFGHLVLLIVLSGTLLLPPKSYTLLLIVAVGLSLAPLYPLMMMLPNRRHSNGIAKRIISYNVAATLLGILVFPLILGFLFKQFGFDLFPIVILFMAVILCCLAGIIYQKKA